VHSSCTARTIKEDAKGARRRRLLRKLPADHRDAQKKALTFHLLTGETFMCSRNGREENEAEKSNRRSTMKKITTLAILSAAALMLPACNENSSTEAIKEKADDAKKAIETNAEQEKEAASKKIDEATEKAKAAAPAAAAAVDNMAEKAKDATSNAADATKNAGERGVNKVEDAAQNAVDAAKNAVASPSP
jgi:hypothetical protein